MNTFEDQVRPVIESNTAPAYDKDQALRLYVEQSEMDVLVSEDIERYREALEETGGAFDDIEPISRFHEAFQGRVDVEYAAAVVGLETEVFLSKIRENLGLQNIGLLVLDSENGSMKRDAWTSSFKDILFALDFPELVDKPPVVPDPDRLPGAVVHIPDTNLRAAIAEELGKSPNAPITVEEMEGLRGTLKVENKGIQDLTGFQFAINLRELDVDGNPISDLSPLSGLINLRDLGFDRTLVSDLSPLSGLINLEALWFDSANISDISPVKDLKNLRKLRLSHNQVSDLSPVAGLVNLEILAVGDNSISDLSPVAGLINLKHLTFSSNNISNLEPLAGLTNLELIFSWGSPISDIPPLAGLTKLERIDICGGNISNLTFLTGLTALKELYLANNEISDISPITGLTELTRLSFSGNDISDISAIVGLANLTWLDLSNNKISNFSPLDGIRENIKLVWHSNPGFPKGGPKIEGPWLWVLLPDTVLDSRTDLLSEASGGAITEMGIATHGATVGGSVGDNGVWTAHGLPPIGMNNIRDMLQDPLSDGVVYGVVSLYSPQGQNTTMYVGSDSELKIWLNGTLIYEVLVDRGQGYDYTDFFPVTLKPGRNVLLVTVNIRGNEDNAFFGFEPGTEYTVANPGISYTFSKAPIHPDDTFTLDIGGENIFDLAGWQFDIAFDPAALEAIAVSEGNFLKTGGTTFFQSGSIDNAAGKITGLNAARLSGGGMSGTGVLLRVRFKAKSGGETTLTLQNFEFGATTGEKISAGPHQITIVVEGQLATGDVNRDGRVSILDLILVSQQLGKRVPVGSAVDVNGDGIVSILDLILVSQEIGNTTGPAAPAVGVESVDTVTIAAWIAQARLEDDGSLAFKQGIENLEALLRSLIPEETALLGNYPNPFNPETWISYQLAESAEVTLTIYDMNGQLVRHFTIGHQAAGVYQSRNRAAYWDGRNQLGEFVASGLYFYTLTVRSPEGIGTGETRSDEFTATRRMLILK